MVPSGRSRTRPGDPQHELVAHLLGQGEGLRGVRVDDHLQQSLAVAQIDEDHPAVVAAAIHPAANGDGLADQGLGDVAAEVASHDAIRSIKRAAIIRTGRSRLKLGRSPDSGPGRSLR